MKKVEKLRNAITDIKSFAGYSERNVVIK